MALESPLPAFLRQTGRHQALLAALGLIAIQVGMGITLKMAQTGGSYSFSPSGSVAISELVKLLLSSVLFRRECARRRSRGIGPKAGGDESHHEGFGHGEHDAELEDQGDGDDADLEGQGNSDDGMLESQESWLNISLLWRYLRGDVGRDKRLGYYLLALCYALINNSVFVSYKLADPGTIQLVKSGGTLVTAMVMVVGLEAALSRTQWAAVCIQLLGLVLTQYEPSRGATYHWNTYLILVAQLVLSALSSVYNQHLLKSTDSSLHADNMVLYGSGTLINLGCHVLLRLVSSSEPGLLQGYNSVGAVLVVLSNVFVGIAMTCVYKYADAVVKCFATAVATGILLYASPLLFGTKLGALALPGTAMVFAASWLYVAKPVPKPAEARPRWRLAKAWWTDAHGHALSLVLTLATAGIVALLTMVETPMATRPMPAPDTNQSAVSPFAHSLAMVRWNSARAQRIPLLAKYEPFFDTLHLSMPGLVPDHDAGFYNWTHDQFVQIELVYMQVADMMTLALAEKPHIDGLLFFHFDAWVDPLAWPPSQQQHMWASYGTPHYACINDTKAYDWWGWDHGLHKAAMAAVEAIDQLGLDYHLRRDEWCVGWSDIYWIPRRFFADFVLLSHVFARFKVFHEVAIATMLHIIDLSRRNASAQSLVSLIDDCWGSCCSSNPTVNNVLETRCGHRLDYLQPAVYQPYYDKLDRQARILHQPSS
ncbi:hypothetical protein CDD81_1825 [Ophiocordyceps australis]|uniref:UDP-galactose transporter n=1 Tax=Ophiocordyceps australis TaxID=1399860 RepID=A0A2C5XYY4_9HYPO|nr:hypothetical protein CDD81_1825 [Ophiocordyceps australis]